MPPAVMANAETAVMATLTVAIEMAIRNRRMYSATPYLRSGPDHGTHTLTKMGKTVKYFS